MNVNEIYNLIKNAVCLQCRKDKAILDVLKQPTTVTAWYGTANRDKRDQIAVLLATIQRHGMLDKGDNVLVRYVISS